MYKKLAVLTAIAASALFTGCGDQSDVVKNGTIPGYPQSLIEATLDNNFDNGEWRIVEDNAKTFIIFEGEVSETLSAKAKKNVSSRIKSKIQRNLFADTPSDNQSSISYHKALKSLKDDLYKKVKLSTPWVDDQEPFETTHLKKVREIYKSESEAKKSFAQKIKPLTDESGIFYVSPYYTANMTMGIEYALNYNKNHKINKEKLEEYNEIVEFFKELDKLAKSLRNTNGIRLLESMPNYQSNYTLHKYIEDAISFENFGKEGNISSIYKKPQIDVLFYKNSDLLKSTQFKEIDEGLRAIVKELVDFLKQENIRLKKEHLNFNKKVCALVKETNDVFTPLRKREIQLKEDLKSLLKVAKDLPSYIEIKLKGQRRALSDKHLQAFIDGSYFSPREKFQIRWLLFPDGEKFELKSLGLGSASDAGLKIGEILDIIYN